MREHYPFGSIFLVGLIAGILCMNLGKSILLENTGLLDEDTMYRMRDMTVDGSALFVYVLRERLGSLLVIAILATTYLGLLVCVGAAFWYGLAAGAFLAAAVLRFGIRGVFFVLAGTMPQYLLYGPAFYAMILWCEETYRIIHRRKRYPEQTETPAVSGRVLKFLLIVAAVLLGCLLESFANPALLGGFLHYSYSARS